MRLVVVVTLERKITQVSSTEKSRNSVWHLSRFYFNYSADILGVTSTWGLRIRKAGVARCNPHVKEKNHAEP